MSKLKLLEKEEVKKTLSPHVLSFLGSYFIPAYLLIWAIVAQKLFELPVIHEWLEKMEWLNGSPEIILFLVLWALGLILVGVILSLTKIRWRVFILYAIFMGVGIGLMWKFGFKFGFKDVKNLLTVYSLAATLVGVLTVEAFRSSHKYVLTNFRIILRGGIVRSHERTIRYSSISDLEYSQGILGRLFNFGSIIPITPSGMGTGSDQTFAAAGASAKVTKKTSVGGLVGGEKGVKVARTRSYWELFGIYPFSEIKLVMENLIQADTSITPVKEQLEVQREMRDLIRQLIDKETSPGYPSISNEEKSRDQSVPDKEKPSDRRFPDEE